MDGTKNTNKVEEAQRKTKRNFYSTTSTLLHVSVGLGGNGRQNGGKTDLDYKLRKVLVRESKKLSATKRKVGAIREPGTGLKV